MNEQSEILIYQSEDGLAVTEVRLEADTVWLTQAQMVTLFGRDQSVISRHIGNIFKEGELVRESNMQKMHIANSDKPVVFFNLDVIISVGYRVKSQQGTRFRQWANRVLKEYLTRGYSLNEKLLQEQNRRLSDLRDTVALIEQTLAHQAVGEDEAKGLLKVIADYAYALTTLDRFDHGSLEIEWTTTATGDFILEYDQAVQIVTAMKGEFDGLFGLEKDQGFKSALGTIYQTFDGKEVYPSVEEKAAHLLYFIVKNHAFSDGNKRIAAAIFLCFMAGHGLLYHSGGDKRIADNALVALTLLIAESRPVEKETIIKVIINLINRNNDKPRKDSDVNRVEKGCVS
ncbi:MAG: cytochrome C biogenesis protein CycH [Zetaproteobacteria bacterium CG12_big_fil_rev_8_21_14_0_65_55_1124]|nr:MAG: cytochrome C biogenesis protein CycH [Zetaproteobacteria bacterium CG1_02_55_237]PIS19672.1 MAG: cytochrome C biogenesis protein CycH [Zetaproteobacteria bacterium CG08_land_8_20_14_0_20_55_17]PIW42970.1 MAG: cytochrome C biogenesis protein CycH [Zetaproteobacteria bacterium CG12_big_fil_rev_8_21_14_0_65_55_1124]PIY54273.1 MAG: cytochrome C biogenesis protein CycH [Zetaproteobacteria bacterium CG_4_10_14_0_8_um_filter_55_43]PIZ40317.1 MAG: cytochrome C biogenesis protein CycH [Zetaprote